MGKKKQVDIDQSCETAIAKGAVDAFQWLSDHRDKVDYLQNVHYIEAFSRMGAARLWLDEEDEGVEGLFHRLIIALPEEDAARKKLVGYFVRRLEKEETVNIGHGEKLVGKRYALFAISI